MRECWICLIWEANPVTVIITSCHNHLVDVTASLDWHSPPASASVASSIHQHLKYHQQCLPYSSHPGHSACTNAANNQTCLEQPPFEELRSRKGSLKRGDKFKQKLHHIVQTEITSHSSDRNYVIFEPCFQVHKVLLHEESLSQKIDSKICHFDTKWHIVTSHFLYNYHDTYWPFY